MAGISIEIAEAKLTAYLNAEEKILTGQRVDMDGRSLTRADLGAVQEGVKLWSARVEKLSRNGGAGGLRVREIILR